MIGMMTQVVELQKYWVFESDEHGIKDRWSCMRAISMILSCHHSAEMHASYKFSITSTYFDIKVRNLNFESVAMQCAHRVLCSATKRIADHS
jgi:hypothetical protein